ncbi:MAG: hypothetical protein QM675_08715 [Protaetiibacter sp.]
MTADKDRTEPSRADRGAIYVILAAGVFGGGFIAGLALVTGVFRLLDPARYPVTLLADIPIETGQGIVQAHGDTIVANAESLSGGAVWALAIADLVFGLALAGVVASAAVVLWRVAQRQPFHRTSYLAAIVAGCCVTFGSLLSQGIGGLGTMMAATELNPALGDFALPAFEFEPLPVVAGFVIIALAYVFRAGTRLQRDTEGLV